MFLAAHCLHSKVLPSHADVVHGCPHVRRAEAVLLVCLRQSGNREHVADLLSRMSGLNYGNIEQRQVNLFDDAGFAILAKVSPSLKDFDWARPTFELESCMEAVQGLVHAVYRM